MTIDSLYFICTIYCNPYYFF